MLTLKGITKNYKVGNGEIQVLKGLDISFRKSEFVSILGPSGCGKTTILRMIGGFDIPTAGTILLDGKDISNLPPNKRPINTVFQKYALFPHLNVYENIAFGLRIKKVSEKEIKQQVTDILKLVNLSGYEKRNISKLSGGQQQRVAIARALVNNPSTIIADEPTGNLDPARSYEIMTLLQEINNLGTTMLIVTHERDLVDQFTNRVITIDEGVIISDRMDGRYA